MANWTAFTTTPIRVDFTPTSSQAGPTKVEIAGWNDDGATGTFDLTYATDMTGGLKSGVPVPVVIKFAGQEAYYTFNAVAGRAVALAISNPNVSAQFGIAAFDSSGAQVANWTAFTTTPVDVDFTPTASQAGPTKVEIAGWKDDGATGTFTLKYTSG